MITLTDRAVRKVLQLADNDGVEKMLRVGVRDGGCSGFSYFMDFDAEPRAGDQVVEYGDLKVVCDNESMELMAGTELDYQTSLLRGGFKFNNPKARRSCSCGDSFSV
jgi:iron-sulfur cluster assembly protein